MKSACVRMKQSWPLKLSATYDSQKVYSMNDDVVYGASLRSHWDLEPNMTFLNNASFGATPRVVMQAQSEWRARMECQPVEFVMRTQGAAMRAAAEPMAAFLGADAQDFVFVDNASTGVSTVVHSLLSILKPGDELLTTSHVYNAVRQTMNHVCALSGAVYKEAYVPFPLQSGSQVRECILNAITPRTRFVIVDHITSPTGCIFPVQDIIADCKERGILVMIDGAHAPGMVPLHLDELGADWYTGNFHKWMYAPKGSAFLWTRRDRQAMTHPLVPSHGYGQGYTAEFDFIGTKDWSPYYCAVDGLHFFEKMGAQKAVEYNTSLNLYAREALMKVIPQPAPCPESMLGFLAAVVLPIELPQSAASDALVQPTAEHTAALMNLSLKLHDRLWDEHRIEVPVMAFGSRILLRTASHVFNEQQQYDFLASILPSLIADAQAHA
jgi:isopenicillin-N epimerase